MKDKKFSKNILIALGYSPKEPSEAIINSERVFLWNLVEVKKITDLKSGT